MTGSLSLPNWTGNLYVGYSGTGSFAQSGGGSSVCWLDVGCNVGSSGTYTLSAGSLSDNDADIGDSGTAYFNQSGGTHSVADTLYLGGYIGGSGTYKLSATGVLSAPSEYVGYYPSYSYGGITTPGATGLYVPLPPM